VWSLYYKYIYAFDICIFNRYLYNYFDYFHILGTLPVYGYTENKVNEWMNVKACRGSRDMAPIILYLGASGRWVIRYTLRPL